MKNDNEKPTILGILTVILIPIFFLLNLIILIEPIYLKGLLLNLLNFFNGIVFLLAFIFAINTIKNAKGKKKTQTLKLYIIESTLTCVFIMINLLR